MATNSFIPAIPLSHPFSDDTHIRPCNIRDSLENCISTLHMLSGLFTDEENDSCDSAQVRRGTFLQLQSVASTLEAIETCLGQEAEMNFAERAVEYEVRRATEQHIESDPEVIAKSTLLAKAFVQAYRSYSQIWCMAGLDQAAS
ncbi:MAG TPA: hypothetical protein P5330_11535, partial [Candidatus Competibacteraceae bacterium]|nr:hypothetical protein [Candidatus Competibacteraceae bacterium]